jgi:solute carrier family 45 protein 1/2/4
MYVHVAIVTSIVRHLSFPEDHARGLSTFTIMAGLGGFLGYGLGGINWDVTALGKSASR